MGIVVLHSGHFSKIFKKLMGTTCDLKWREEKNEREILWVTRPGHPIVEGIDDHFILPREEMYGEFFDIPEPECTRSSSAASAAAKSSAAAAPGRAAPARSSTSARAMKRSRRYHDKNVLQVIENAVKWASAGQKLPEIKFGNRKLGWIG